MRRIPSMTVIAVFIGLLVVPVRAQGSGKTNIQDLLPKEAIGYVHIQDIQKTAAQVRAAAMKRLPAKEAEKFDTQIKQVMAMASMGAMRLGIDLDKVLGEIDGLHAALLDIKDPNVLPPFVLAAESVRDGYFDKLVQSMGNQDDLQPRVRVEHKGVKIYTWITAGDGPNAFALDSIQMGNLLILSNSVPALKKMIDARTAKAGNRLSDNPYLAQARGIKGEEGKHRVAPRLSSYGFVDIHQLLDKIVTKMPESIRREFDLFDEIVEVTKIKVLTWATTIEGDIATCEAEVTFDSGAEFYDSIRQEPGDLKLLRLIPEDAFMYGVGRFPNPEKTWDKVSDFLGDREKAMGVRMSEVEEGFRKATGVTPEEFAKVLGTESGFFFLPVTWHVERKTEWGHSRSSGPVFGICVEVKDVKRAEEILRALANQGVPFSGLDGTLKKETYKGVDYYMGSEASDDVSGYAVLDSTIVLSNTPDGIKKAIDAFKEGKSIAKNKKHEAVGKPLGPRHSKMFYIDTEKTMKWMLGEFKEDASMRSSPESAIFNLLVTGLQTTLATTEEKGRLKITTSSSGPFAWACSAAPVSFFFGSMSPMLMTYGSSRAMREKAGTKELEERPVNEVPVPPPAPPPPVKKRVEKKSE